MGMGMGSAMLLRNEAVQKELSITDEQMTKLKEVIEVPRGEGANRPNFRDMSEEEREKALEEMAKRTAEQEKKIAEILDEKQVARLKQVRRQVSGATGIVNDEELAKELSLTEEQTSKIRQTVQTLRESMRELGGGGGGFAEVREKMNAEVMKVLTDDQKAKYKELLGEPFDLSQLRRGGPGGQRRSGN
jgi:Spy/CpxP family protein refolding chaperone